MADRYDRTRSRLDRRTFLVVTTGTALAAACTDGDTSGSSSTDNSAADAPRDTSSAADAQQVEAVEAPDAPFENDPFTLGVAAGDPTDDSLILWTRLAPAPDAGGGMVDSDGAPLGDVEIVVDVAADSEFAELILSERVLVHADDGHTVHFDATGLGSHRWVHYRFRVGDFTSTVGRARTAPATDDNADSLTIAVASCQSFEDGYYNAWRDVAADEDVELVVFLGDYIYENAGRSVAAGAARDGRGPECRTLDEYRDRYSLYRSDPHLRAAHARCAWTPVWDDHEVDNNYAGLLADAEGSGDAAAIEAFRARRAAAYRAWWEHQPVRIDPPTDETLVIRRAVDWGGLVHLVLVDTRQDRDDQACGDPSLSFDPPCAEATDPERRMMSDDDEEWLLDELTTSDATWNVIGNQTVMTDLTVGGAILNYDQWDGYAPQRDRILTAIAAAELTNVVVVTGDIHIAGAAALTVGHAENKRVVASELVGTSISSEAPFPVEAEQLIGSMLSDVEYINVRQRGWCKVVFRDSTASAEFRVVADNRSADSPVAVDATVTIDASTPGIASVR